MNRPEVLDALQKIAQDAHSPSDLSQAACRDAVPALHAAALDAFGSWEGALSAALIRYAQRAPKRAARTSAASTVRQDAPATRRVSEAAEYPLYLFSAQGLLSTLSLADLPTQNTPTWTYFPDGPGKEAWPDRAYVSLDDDGSYFALAANGTGSSLHRPHFAAWTEDARPARFVDHVLRAEDSPVVSMFPRRELRLAQRIYAVADDGQIKASNAEEYAKRVTNEAIDVILPRADARAYAMFSGYEDTPIFMASSGGKAIVFSAEELRSQGLRAQGVRGINLDVGHTLVGAFAPQEDEVILITAEGYIKRMALDEFRPQGRGGAGLQTCKLADEDRVVSMVQSSINDDLLIIGTDGQYLRMPVWAIPQMGRPARGDRLVAMEEGQQILSALIVPAGN